MHDKRSETSKVNIWAAWRSNKNKAEAKEKGEVKKPKKTHTISKGEALLRIMNGTKNKKKKKRKTKKGNDDESIINDGRDSEKTNVDEYSIESSSLPCLFLYIIYESLSMCFGDFCRVPLMEK